VRLAPIEDKPIHIWRKPDAVKNTDFLVYLVTRHGSTTRFARDEEGWVQTAPSGTRRRCTAEQVLNHLLPALLLGDSVVTTKVKVRRGRHSHPRLNRLKKAK
jgi:hypothetical protein